MPSLQKSDDVNMMDAFQPSINNNGKRTLPDDVKMPDKKKERITIDDDGDEDDDVLDNENARNVLEKVSNKAKNEKSSTTAAASKKKSNTAVASKEKKSTAAVASKEKTTSNTIASKEKIVVSKEKTVVSKEKTSTNVATEEKSGTVSSKAVPILTLNPWVYNQDTNNISGNVTGHHRFEDGLLVNTSELREGTVIQEGYVVQTINGSKYHLGNPKAEEKKKKKKKKKKKATNNASIPAEADANTEANAKKDEVEEKKASIPAVEVEEKKASIPAVEVEEKKASIPTVEAAEKMDASQDKAYDDALVEGDVLFKYNIIFAQQGLLEIAKKKRFTKELAAKFLKRYGVGYDGVIGGIAPDNEHLMLELESLAKMRIS